MNSVTTTLTERDDLDLLTGAQAQELIRAALTGTGGDVDDLHVQVDRVHHRPGSGVSVAYRVGYGSPAGQVSEYLVASTAPSARGDEGTALLDDGERQVRVWRHVDDPALPGLRAACDPACVREWLVEAGVSGPDAEVRLEMLSYRPTRRAVLRATAADTVVFLKVLPPERSEALTKRHLVLERAGIGAPRVLVVPVAGVNVLSAAEGRPLANALADARLDPTTLPHPGALEEMLDALPVEVMDLPRRASWADRVDFHAVAAAAALPEAADRVADLEARIGVVLAATPAGPEVVTHGDFYEANIFTAGGRLTGIIDVDSVGPGRRIDDLATLLGHLAVLRDLAPGVYPHVPEIGAQWLDHFSRRVDPAGLRARTAAVVLSLVAGTTREQGMSRLDVAADWLADAESTLTTEPR